MDMSEYAIEALVAALPKNAGEHDKNAYREALRKLVRLAQAEQMISIEKDFHTACLAASHNYKRTP